MGDGNLISFLTGLVIPDLSSNKKDERPETDRRLQGNDKPPKSTRDALPLLDRKWQTSEADGRKNNLLERLSQTTGTAAENLLNRQTGSLRSGIDNIARFSFDTLFSLARDHKDFKEFRNQPREFWNQVRQLSELRVIDTLVKGNFEPRVFSRYGELLDKLNRQGTGLERFLTTLPPREASVFAARYQLDKTFGANRLFVGNGVVITERGEFSLQTFLSNNGRNVRLTAQNILSLIGQATHRGSNQPLSEEGLPLGQLSGDLSPDELFLFQNGTLRGQSLFSTSSAALLSLSLALYQNADAMLSLETLADQFLFAVLPHEQQKLNQPALRSALDGERLSDAALQQDGDSINPSVAALINGALTTVEKFRRSAYEGVGLQPDTESDGARFSLAAGATGAIMSATIGCITPLAGKAAGETLGLAASIVTGLHDGGLRTFGASTLVSIVTENVQALLNVSSVTAKNLADGAVGNLLNAGETIGIPVNDLQRNFFDRRMKAFIIS